jgi:hypothetical protein
VGEPELARILEDAIRVFPNGRPVAELESRRAHLGAFSEKERAKLARLDEGFHAAAVDLDRRIDRFVRENEAALRE